MKFSIIVPVLNQYKLFAEALNMIVEKLDGFDVELVIIDNDSDEGGQKLRDALNNLEINWKTMRVIQELKLIDNYENTGNYPIFEQVFKIALGEILCYFHSDVFVYQKGWNRRLIEEFEKNPKLGLIGFIGSNEIDNFGGRGLGTMSNFQGLQVKNWKGSVAEIHGKRITNLRPAALVDGCSMIFRRKCLADIGFRREYGLHHFYDRLMCCQVLEKGWEIGVLGIECDHISGQTVNTEIKYFDAVKKWFKENFNIEKPEDWAEIRKDWVRNPNNPSFEKIPTNWDHCQYLENEYQFLTEWRDTKKFIPLKINKDY